ncbi:efflux RND transporter periplasmic adaptor subunit [Bradyrhizobium sp. Arg816]|uniref:efflux RND transporter periplasmic adaptor subunit n=1 Tax=Bradyrhizobium sp. Arg816 TaxID=2998491 RepID=UPI00249EF2DA|nr:HlyD family efflux transporter periplasmic adaptor subunit [Bradyrhizobium sp. Arg816]MDI3560528.1 HlyD family efflux transporter periplasmic adaptor subunit [Bradyrhizobium sp. Arg816]
MTIAAALLAIVALSLTAWFWQNSASPPRSASESTPVRTFTVAPSAVVSRLTLTGTLRAGKVVPIAAPFDGPIRERRVQLGDRVVAGDTVLVMDPGEVQSRFRDAQGSLLKASMALDVLLHWDTSPDVTRAKRALEAADAALAVLERQVTETKALFDRGIVSRNEFDGLVQQRDAQRVAAVGSRLDLQTTLARGNAENRQLADLEMKNAQARLADLKQQVDGSTVLAPSSGILVRPPATTPSAQGSLSTEPGSRVSRGQALFSVADLSTLLVVGRIDEVDVNRVHVGQTATITSDAFASEIAGRIVGVSAEANTDQGGNPAPSFEIRAAMSVEAARRELVRLGMSARMTIELSANAKALVVPIEAVGGTREEPRVRIREPESGREFDRRVVLGTTTETGVEVLSGLGAGEVLLLVPSSGIGRVSQPDPPR